MGRCEGYYKLENRRCDRDAEAETRAADGEFYAVCGYHGRHLWTATVARWHGDSGLRRSGASPVRALPQPPPFVWA